LIKNSLPSVFWTMSWTSSLGRGKYMEMAVDLMVIPRSISSCLYVSPVLFWTHGNLPGVHESHVSRLGSGDDTSLGDKGIGKGGFTVIDVSDNRHVSDVGRSVHETSDLSYGEAGSSVESQKDDQRKPGDERHR
jgi:hypothetical protein